MSKEMNLNENNTNNNQNQQEQEKRNGNVYVDTESRKKRMEERDAHEKENFEQRIHFVLLVCIYICYIHGI